MSAKVAQHRAPKRQELEVIEAAEAAETADGHLMVHLEAGDRWVTMVRSDKGIVLPVDNTHLKKVRVPAGEYPLAMISLIGSCTEPGPRARRRFRGVPAVGGHHPDGPEFQAGVVVTVDGTTYQVQVQVTDRIASWVEEWHRAHPKAAGKFCVNDPKGAVRRFRMAQCLQALWRGRKTRQEVARLPAAAAEDAHGVNAPDAAEAAEPDWLSLEGLDWTHPSMDIKSGRWTESLRV